MNELCAALNVAIWMLSAWQWEKSVQQSIFQSKMIIFNSATFQFVCNHIFVESHNKFVSGRNALKGRICEKATLTSFIVQRKDVEIKRAIF